MARSSFRKDLARSRDAVIAVLHHLIDDGRVAYELEGKEEQKRGDICLEGDDGALDIEVKYDIMAAETGNLCFEMSNGSKPTGIMITLADLIYYVVPRDGYKEVLVFKPCKLRKFIQDPSKVTIKNGGDKWKFILAIAPINDILEAGLAEETFRIE